MTVGRPDDDRMMSLTDPTTSSQSGAYMQRWDTAWIEYVYRHTTDELPVCDRQTCFRRPPVMSLLTETITGSKRNTFL